ncbi:MAG: RodZ domain-containing protein [Acidobacteriota bacterium]
MNESFGQRLKRERELRGVAIDEIAQATKISSRMLDALESNRFDLLPGGVFNRGFIRAYARYLGLNEEDVVNDYLDAIQKSAPETAQVPAQPPSPAPSKPVPPVLIVGVVAAGVLIAIALVLRNYRGEPKPAVPAAPQTQRAETGPVETTPTVVINQFAPLPEKAEELPAPITIEMQFQSPTWVKVSTDGKQGEPIVYGPGQTQVFTAENEIGLWVGNAGGFTYLVNGKPGIPIGLPGQVRRAVFNRETIPGMQAPEAPEN